ncbi:MAG: aldo/keto reductase [Phycisphaeraceae bacterium]|nr:aldo/keto reductase [Phycisphaeraceae bacterium]
MKYINLGRTGLRVSRLCLGTMNFGHQANEPDSFSIMDKALNLGFNFFDTANVYGGKPGEGITEKIIGRWLAQGGQRRERMILATKCYGSMGEGENEDGLSAYNIKRACEASLRRLQTDHIDLYQMHHIERATPWDEIWQAMEQLVAEGKVTYIGSSNFAGWDIAKACEMARHRHFLGLVCEQSKYSLQTRMIELEVLPACRDYGLGVIAWSPLASGALGGVHTTDNGRRAGKSVQKLMESFGSQINAYEAFCRQLGEEPANVALAWVLSNPDITGPIIGPRTMEQLTGCMRCLDITLDEPTLDKLDTIWPGPGGAAPKAYAW